VTIFFEISREVSSINTDGGMENTVLPLLSKNPRHVCLLRLKTPK
jgi:hypothetical protein